MKSFLFLCFFSVALLAQVLSPILVQETDDNIDRKDSLSQQTSWEVLSKQQDFILEELQYISALNITRNGGPSGATSVFLRGFPSQSTSVYLGDVRLSDPSIFSRTSDPSFLPSCFIEDVSLFRGANGVSFGADATAGAIKLNPRIARENKNELRASYGTYEQRNLCLYSGRVYSKGSVAFGLSHFQTRGFSNVAQRDSAEADGAQTNSFFLNSVHQLHSKVENELFFQLGVSEFELDQDSLDDPNYRGDKEETMLSESIDLKLKKNFGIMGKAQLYSVARRDINVADSVSASSNNDDFRGKNINWEVRPYWKSQYYQGYLSYSRLLEVSENNTSSAYTSVDKTAYSNSLSTLNSFSLDKWNFELGGRYSKHEIIGENSAYQAGIKYSVLDNTFLVGRFGEGFKTPTLIQLFNTVSGQTNVRAEKSQSYDVGIEYLNSKTKWQLIYFTQDLTDRIGTDSSFKTAQIDEKITSEGVEFYFSHSFKQTLLSASYTLTDSFTEDTGASLKVPKHKFSFSAKRAFNQKFSIFTRARLVSRSYDYSNKPLLSYQVVDLGGDFQLSQNVKIFMGAENLFNRQYSTAYGYNTAGLSFQAGLQMFY